MLRLETSLRHRWLGIRAIPYTLQLFTNQAKGRVESPSHGSVRWVCFLVSSRFHPSAQEGIRQSGFSGGPRGAEASAMSLCLAWRSGPSGFTPNVPHP